MKPTPGPWDFEEAEIDGETQYGIYRTNREGEWQESIGTAERADDARLMAWAPDLREALIALDEQFASQLPAQDALAIDDDGPEIAIRVTLDPVAWYHLREVIDNVRGPIEAGAKE